MPVITNGGLVGRIMKVYNDRSTVRLVTDPNFSMAVKIVPGPDHPPPATTTPPRARRRPATPPARRRGADNGRRPARSGADHTSPPPRRRCRSWNRAGSPGRAPTRTSWSSRSRPRARVQAGDIVSTSGVQESLAPADLPVGRVTSVARHAGSGLLEVHVAPSANLANLNFVKVLLYCTECGSALTMLTLAARPWVRVPLVTRRGPRRAARRCSPTCARSGRRRRRHAAARPGAGMVAGLPSTACCAGSSSAFVYDLMLRTPFGLSALAYACIGYAAGYLQALVSSAPWWIGMLIMGAASAVSVAIYAAIGTVFGLRTPSTSISSP